MASTSSAARLEALTRRSAVTTRKAARGAVSVALEQVRITPRPQFPHTRPRNGLSAGAVGAPNSSAQCVQKRVSSSCSSVPARWKDAPGPDASSLAPIREESIPLGTIRTWDSGWWRSAQDLQRIGARNRGTPGRFAVALAAAALVAGCGSEPSHAVPAACAQGPGPLERALARAPGEVKLGGTRPSACFVRGGDPGGVESLGLTFLPAAEHLAVEARAQPRGPAAMRLGFLIGAVRRGT